MSKIRSLVRVKTGISFHNSVDILITVFGLSEWILGALASLVTYFITAVIVSLMLPACPHIMRCPPPFFKALMDCSPVYKPFIFSWKMRVLAYYFALCVIF